MLFQSVIPDRPKRVAVIPGLWQIMDPAAYILPLADPSRPLMVRGAFTPALVISLSVTSRGPFTDITQHPAAQQSQELKGR